MISALMRRIHEPIYAERLKVLRDTLLPLMKVNDSVLDVGCGSGALAAAILADSRRPAGLRVRGLERYPRDPMLIEVDQLTTDRFPYDDRSFDVVTILDVLHHDRDPVGVLREAARVSRRLVVVKDHKPEGLFAYRRICLLDWAANRPYGIECLYDYPDRKGWHDRFNHAGLKIESEQSSMRLYPRGWNWCFAGKLHYLAILSPHASAS